MARSGHWEATEGFGGEEEGRWCELPENALDARWRRGGRCAGREPSGMHMTPRGTPRTRPGGGRGVRWAKTVKTLCTSGCVCSTCFLEGLCPLPCPLPMPGSRLVPGWHLARGWDFHLHVPCWSVPRVHLLTGTGARDPLGVHKSRVGGAPQRFLIRESYVWLYGAGRGTFGACWGVSTGEKGCRKGEGFVSLKRETQADALR